MKKPRKEIRWTNGANTSICRRNIWQKYGAKGLLRASFHLCFVFLKLASNSRKTFYAAKPKYSHTKISSRASIKTTCNNNKISKKTSPSFISKALMRVFDGVANIYRNFDISGNRLWLSKPCQKNCCLRLLTSLAPRHKVTWFPKGQVPGSCSAVNWSSRFSYTPPFFFLHNPLSFWVTRQSGP